MTEKNIVKKTKKTVNSPKTKTELSVQSNENHIVGIVGNTLWILASEAPTEAEQTLKIRELDQLLPISWFIDRADFCLQSLAGHNLLENGDFGGSGNKSIANWSIEAEAPAVAGVDFSSDWHLKAGHTAFLYAPEGAPRPSLSTIKGIPVIDDNDIEYRFSGFFATHRASGLVTLSHYDQYLNKINEDIINVLNEPEYAGGKSLKSYAHIEAIFTPYKGSKYIHLKIELDEQAEPREPEPYLFFTQLYLGINDDNQSQHGGVYSSESYQLSLKVLEEKWTHFGKVKLPKKYKSKLLSVEFKNGLHELEIKEKDISKRSLPGQAGIGNFFDDHGVGAFAIDKCIVIEKEGLLLYGWSHFLQDKMRSIYLHGPKGIIIDIDKLLFRVSRRDVVDSYGQHYSDISEFSGYICYVPIQVNVRQTYYIEVELTNGSSKWLKVPIAKNQHNGLPLIKDLLTWVPAPDRIRPKLFDLFDQQLGNAIDTISAARTAFNKPIYQRQLGVAPNNPTISIIVPLYGRYDFVRYQLSHFSSDPDFQNIDLIYVIDDPSIITETNELATVYYPVFRVPFRTIWYESNLGFGGANNIGVSVARGKTVLLMNSDVLPKQKGWVSYLQNALYTLPEAGAVGPLLQFADESVQHAGMEPRRDERLPGFLLNIHPGKGQPWTGAEHPQEFPMLTAACLMLRKQDYLDLGGFDEGYIIGDFEDSDLCLALRKRGKRLWLVPETKLWHLERQSQNLESISSFRHLLTLYNGWRFHKKIQQGLIADPVQVNGPIRIDSLED